jgi:hypothetical protein
MPKECPSGWREVYTNKGLMCQRGKRKLSWDAAWAIRERREQRTGLRGLSGYYTVLIPYDPLRPSEWHPTTSKGPFSVLTRGAFKSKKAARDWADTHLNSDRYEVKYVR